MQVTPQFAVIYRGYLLPGKEPEYRDAWQKVAKYFVEKCGALGSCLHRTSDDMWVAYSRWPNQQMRDAAWPGDKTSVVSLPPEIQHAVATLQSCLDPARKLPEICMEIVYDMLM